MKRNVIFLAAPFSGVRPLAERLVDDEGYQVGSNNVPSLLDPSVRSFENNLLISANQDMLRPARETYDWNQDEYLNWATCMDPNKVEAPSRVWKDRIRLVFGQGPVALKDPQLAFTYRHWVKLLLPEWVPSHEQCLLQRTTVMHYVRTVVVFRFPLDMMRSIFDAIDKGHLGGVPKDPDHFIKLWRCYYETILQYDPGDFLYLHTDQLVRHGQPRPRTSNPIGWRAQNIDVINEGLGVDLKPLDPAKIRYKTLRDKSAMPKAVWELYDKLWWLATRRGVNP